MIIMVGLFNDATSYYGHTASDRLVPCHFILKWAISIASWLARPGRDLNPRPSVPKASALPLHQRGIGLKFNNDCFWISPRNVKARAEVDKKIRVVRRGQAAQAARPGKGALFILMDAH